MIKQLTFSEISDDYKKFVDKFKPKKTTDDCYTPPNIYEAVKNWVCAEYNIRGGQIVRPFYPGGDYEREEYAPDAVVLDNPPFSIITPIVDFYLENGIKFFLFAPHLTNFTIGKTKVCHVIENVKIAYENGAVVNTSFVTNLDPRLVLASPELFNAVKEANDANTKEANPLPKYEYPENVIMAATLGKIIAAGVGFEIRREEAVHIRKLDSQRAHNKALYGSGFLISDQAAERVKRATVEAAKRREQKTTDDGEHIVWELSENEKRVVEELTKRGNNE